jgi:plasmid stability protein
MAVLNIRSLPDEVHRKLRVRAARAGRSMEAEARAILTAVCLEDTEPVSASQLQDWIAALYGGKKPEGIVETFLMERRQEGMEG